MAAPSFIQFVSKASLNLAGIPIIEMGLLRLKKDALFSDPTFSLSC